MCWAIIWVSGWFVCSASWNILSRLATHSMCVCVCCCWKSSRNTTTATLGLGVSCLSPLSVPLLVVSGVVSLRSVLYGKASFGTWIHTRTRRRRVKVNLTCSLFSFFWFFSWHTNLPSHIECFCSVHFALIILSICRLFVCSSCFLALVYFVRLCELPKNTDQRRQTSRRNNTDPLSSVFDFCLVPCRFANWLIFLLEWCFHLMVHGYHLFNTIRPNVNFCINNVSFFELNIPKQS